MLGAPLLSQWVRGLGEWAAQAAGEAIGQLEEAWVSVSVWAHSDLIAHGETHLHGVDDDGCADLGVHAFITPTRAVMWQVSPSHCPKEGPRHPKARYRTEALTTCVTRCAATVNASAASKLGAESLFPAGVLRH